MFTIYTLGMYSKVQKLLDLKVAGGKRGDQYFDKINCHHISVKKKVLTEVCSNVPCTRSLLKVLAIDTMLKILCSV